MTEEAEDPHQGKKKIKVRKECCYSRLHVTYSYTDAAAGETFLAPRNAAVLSDGKIDAFMIYVWMLE